jgi:tetratricopeptide (TPR) repeat protein
VLSTADSKLLAEAFRLLQQKRAQEASAIASEVATRSPQSADALHMLALCSKALGDNERAAATFAAARKLAPDDANLLGNYANLLSRMGRAAEAIELYRRQLSLAPAHPDGWMNLGLGLIDTGDFKGACDALDRAVTIRPRHAPAWHGLASARRGAGDLQGAEAALRQAVSLDPANAAAWISLGVLRRLLGDPTDSLACYDKARGAGFVGPEIDDAEASACLDLGEAARALVAARRLTQAAPGYAPGQSMLAHILWEHGASLAPGEDPLETFRKALAEQPSNTLLRHEFIRFLLAANNADEALEQIRRLRAQGDASALVVMEANALEILGEHEAAATLFAAAYASLKADAGFLNLYVRHLLRKGSAEQAAAYALDALESEPHNQLSLAYLGIAWRLTGDSREDWLCGYDRLVAEVCVETPATFADQPAFLCALEATLLRLHTAKREPVNQSLRGGSQTSGVLFGRRDPVIAALRDAIHEAVLRYAGQLPDDLRHPFLRRKSTNVRFAGSWSVRLWSSGRHVNHYHQEGWISSAYYVSLPPSVAQEREGDTAGCIQFGQPPAELGLDLAPRRVIRPRAGGLVLFPSYLWHGTVPFEDDAPRLTVAFDAVPTQRSER